MNRVDERQVREYYAGLAAKHADARRRFGRPLTLAEKILTAHLAGWNEGESAATRGKTIAFLRPAAVRMQDATAQMALLQYMQADMGKVAVPTTIHCDHLIRAQVGASADLQRALTENDEVYRFLKSAAQKHGIGFWPPGSGIIHQVVLEKYAYPGGLIIGTDSHTPNAGGLGMLAIGVGGADAMEVMAGQPWSIKWPKLIGVRLTGKLNGWTAPKDVILKLAGLLTVDGGTGAIIEYFGDGARSISCTGKATITNMGAELGATTSVFPLDEKMLAYLRATERGDIADLAEANMHSLTADPEVEADYGRYFDKVIEIDLSTLEPHVVGPHTPDLARPISELKKELLEKGYPRNLRYALIGSCTNSSYEDMTAAASIARQAQAAGIKAKIGLLVTPGSDQIMRTLQRDSVIEVLEAIGGTVLANACGPCIGQWQRSDVKDGEQNSIISSFNRNFPRRNDGFASTLSFIASPEIVTAIALSGDLGFNPLTDPLVLADGTQVMLQPPISHELPEKGFVFDSSAFIAPAADGSQMKVEIAPGSNRLELLTPLDAWSDSGVASAPVLLKAQGKCTTDHISPAGPWLKFRGHLTNISDNMFNGALNSFTGGNGTGVDVTTGKTAPLHVVAKSYKAQNLNWVVIGDYNYGEGSSREHAAMSPRFLGCAAIIARSFARIHETNLKKQGILALTFADPADYDRVAATDRFNLPSPRAIAPGKQVVVTVVQADGGTYMLTLNHTLTATEIGWFKAGSMLNAIKEERSKKGPEMATANPAFAAGLEGVIACRTRLSDVDGTNGRLVFSGFNAVELATTKTFEEVWFLLHEGRLPSCAEHADFREMLETLGKPTRQEVDLMKRLRKGNSPLSAFRSIISAIAVQRNYQPWLNRDASEAAKEVMALAALAPAIVEVIHTGRTPVKKKGNRGYADRYLWGVLGHRPEQSAMEAVQTYLILTMDHGMNASTFAGRVTASTGADVGAALTSAIGTLSGPLHGGAPGPVLDMLDGIGSADNAASWVAGEMEAGRRIMGFGHRVYRTDDPRSLTLRGVAEKLKSPRVELARAVETEVLAALAAHQQKKAAAGKPVRALRVNVEFWTAVVLEHVGIPRELFSSTFCTSRIAGWSEHIIEQLNDNKLFRPLSLYSGPEAKGL